MTTSDPEGLYRLLVERLSAGDLDGIMALFEEGATLIAPDGTHATGNGDVRAQLENLIAMAPRVTSLATRSVVVGNVALMSNRWRMTFGKEGDGGFEGSSTEVARRQPDGTWRLVIADPLSAGMPPKPSPAAAVDPAGFEQLRYEEDGPVVRITLDRPERNNALSIQLSEELNAALERVRDSGSVRVLVIGGAGETFCAGDDITEMGKWGDANQIMRRVRGYQRMADTLAGLDAITICAVDGFAVGGGLEITMASDFVIATTRAKWGMPEVDVGITPGWGGTTRMARLIGRRMTKEINLLGALHPARRAVELGLWNRVVAEDRLREEVDALVEVLLSKNQQALRQLKFIIDTGVEADLHTAQGFEALSAGLTGAVNGAWQVADADQASGIVSFIDGGEKWKARRELARDFWIAGNGDAPHAPGGKPSDRIRE